MSRFFATLKRRPVELGVISRAEAETVAARQVIAEEIRAADDTELRNMATERGITFHPDAPSERIRDRLLRMI